MLNASTFLLTQLHSLFVNVGFDFLFIFLFFYTLLCILNSNHNVSFFFNIIVFILTLIMYLFKINVGAFAGFLFLCEVVSLFALFIILNKVSNNELIDRDQYNFYKNYLIVVVFLTVFYFFNLNFNKVGSYVYNNFFIFELLNSNDFWATTIVFFSNIYNFYLLIVFFLILITVMLIITINSIKRVYNTQSVFTQNLFSFFLKKLFHENNFIFFKNKVFINFFKKKC